MASILHKKRSDIPDFTQPELDEQIALGNFPPGTTLADIVLNRDWLDDHDLQGHALILPNEAISANNSVIAAGDGWGFYPIYNNTGAAFTVKLPPVPAANQLCSFADALQNAGSNTITIDGNGNNISGFTGIGTTTTIASNGGTINPLSWDAINDQWVQFG